MTRPLTITARHHELIAALAMVAKPQVVRAIAFGAEWRRVPISPYRRYEVSIEGRVRRGSRELVAGPDSYGYRRVQLYYAGIGKAFKVHRLVCEAWHGSAPTDRHEVCHIDGDKANNHASNLRWGTRADNTADSLKHGTFHRPTASAGEAHHAAKLTQDQVTELRSLAETRSQRSLAQHFGISQTQVCHILGGKKWKS